MHRINTSYLIELNLFCETDKDIENCRRKLEHEVFRHEWFIAWFDKEGAPFHRLPLFNKAYFKEALQRLYIKAHDFIMRFSFVGYYYVKNIEDWLLAVSQIEEKEGDTDFERQLKENILASFPFGVIPLGLNERESYGDYLVIENRNTMVNTIHFKCHDEELAKHYDFVVLDYGARFQSMPYCGFGNVRSWAINYGEDYVPISPFDELRRQKRLVIEGETSLFDANSMSVYPESIAYVKPQKDADLEDVADETLFSLDNILQAKQRDNFERQDMALNDARFQLQRNTMKRTLKSCASQRGCGAQPVQMASTLIWDYKMAYNRPSAYEAMRYLPAPIEISGTRPGNPVVNVAERERKYENDVCTVMRLPYVFFKPHGLANEIAASNRTSLGSGNTSHNDMFQKLLETEVSSQHALFNSLFKEIYYHTFRKLDSQLFQSIHHSNLFDGIEAGIQFDHVIVKSDEALMGLVKFYEAGIVPSEVIRRLVYKNFSIPLTFDDEVINLSAPVIKKQNEVPLTTLTL